MKKKTGDTPETWVINNPADLQTILKPLNIVAKPSAILPVLENIIFNGTQAVACNGAIWMAVNLETPIKFAVSAKMFVNLIQSAGTAPVTVTKSQAAIDVTFGRSRYTLPTESEYSFPPLPDPGEKTFATFEFNDALRALCPVVGENDMIQLQNRVHVQGNWAYAINDRHTVFSRRKIAGADGLKFSIPLSSAEILAQVADGKISCTYTSDPFRGTFTIGKYTFVTNLNKGLDADLDTFMQSVFVAPKSNPEFKAAICTVKHSDLLSCTSRMGAMLKMTDLPHITISIKDDTMAFSYAGEMNSGQEECPCQCDMDVLFTINLDNLTKVLRIDQGETVFLTIGYAALQYSTSNDGSNGCTNLSFSATQG